MRGLMYQRWTGFGLLVMGLMAMLLFLYGFFTLKYLSGKLSHLDDLPNFIDGISIDGQQVYNSGENTVVFMVIDSLRYDLLTEEYMPYAGQLLKNKSACIYVSAADLPTMTMPRIKAMMTGSVTTFHLDVVLNFGAPEVRGDSVVRIANSRGRKSIMYGDETWLRLFPGLWTEYEGTNSFFLTDHSTEIDNNVTRHLDKVLTPDEKKKPTFDFLVLHYLGLDHIGHLEGIRSPKVKPKLLEMDEVVKKIFTAMQKWDRNGVLLVCGDHGMRDDGGHGGSSRSEVLVPLLVAKSSNFSCPHPLGPSPTVAQVDMAPTISWLLGGPPPADSVGRILPALLPQDIRQHLYLLHVIADHNSKQFLPTDTEFYKQLKRAEKQFAHYLATGQQSAAKISKEHYEELLQKMAEYLAQTTVYFDMFAIGIAIVLLYLIATSLLCITLYSIQSDCRQNANRKLTRHQYSYYGSINTFFVIFFIFAAIMATLCFSTETKSQICSFNSLTSISFTIIALFFTVTYYVIKTGIEKIKDLSCLKDLNTIDHLLISGTIFYGFSFYGTSFIEEEHMTWYFFWTTLMFFVILIMYLTKNFNGATEVQDKPELNRRTITVGVTIMHKWLLLIALHRYLRTMNQTGHHWLFLADTADWLNAPKNAFYLRAHLVIGTLSTLVACLYNLRYMNNLLNIHTVLTMAATASIFCYRIASQALESPFEDIKLWDRANIVNVFWAILIIQFVFVILSYIRALRNCGFQPLETQTPASKRFVYNKLKARTEDNFCDPVMEELRNVDKIKLNLVRSASHLMLNNMMLTVILLMRPHNVIMVPSIYVTCVLTSKCMDHKLLNSKAGRKTEGVDIISRTLVHVWIGILFFFYQGNSNSLASVDVASGYVGLREYCPVRVAARIGLHAYAGPALAGAALFAGLAAHAPHWHLYLQQIWRATNILALYRVWSLVVYCIVATVQRYHPFVWSVFSPKLLYDFVATVFSIQIIGFIALIELLAHISNWLARICTYRSIL